MLKHFGEFFAAVVAFLIAFWQWLVAVWALNRSLLSDIHSVTSHFYFCKIRSSIYVVFKVTLRQLIILVT
jgi:hypothetical protein